MPNTILSFIYIKSFNFYNNLKRLFVEISIIGSILHMSRGEERLNNFPNIIQLEESSRVKMSLLFC